jgi:hypothetical protein
MADAMQRPTPWGAFAVGGLVAAFGVAAAWIFRVGIGYCADSPIPGQSHCESFTSNGYAIPGTVILVIATLVLFVGTFYAQPPLRRILIAVALLVIVVTAIATPIANLALPIPDIPEDFYR